MKRVLSLLLSFLLLLLDTLPVQAAQEPALTNDFVGVINLYTSADPEHVQWNAVLHEEELVMMTPEDIAEIAGLSRMDYNSTDNSYDFCRGSYRVHVDVETLTARIYIDVTASDYLTPYGDFHLDYIGTAVLDGEECTIFPLEQMLYLLNVQWKCQNDRVYTFAPKETLWNIMGDYVSMVNYVPKKTDLIGTSFGDILSNSFMYSMLAFGDEVSPTTFVPGIGFTDKKTKQALLTMSVPCENIIGDLETEAEQRLNAYVSHVSDVAKAMGTGGDIGDTLNTGFELFSNGFAKLKKIGDTEDMQDLVKSVEVATAAISTMADIVEISVAMTRTVSWTETYLDQMNYLAEVSDPSYGDYCAGINNQAAVIVRENAKPMTMAALESAVAIGINTAEFLANNTIVGKAFSAYKFGVAVLSTLPEVKVALEAGDDAYNAMDLCNLATFMRSQYVKALDDNAGGVTQAYLDNVRLTGSLLMSASAHAFDKMYSVEKASNKDTGAIANKLLYTNTATLRFEESAMYDPSLLLQSGFSNLYSEEDGGMRQKIPPEYVHDAVPLRISACIGEYNGVVYCLREVSGSDFVKLPVEAAEYDYISSFLFYDGKLYYSCKDAGTSDYRSALYRCNPDGTELEKIFGDEDLDYTTGFHISYGILYPHGSYKYYNIEEETILTSEEYIYSFGALPDWYNEEYVFSHGSGSTITRAKYDRGNPYMREGEESLIYVDSSWSRICGLTSEALYCETDANNTASLYRYDFKTGVVTLVDSKPSAGSGGYFNW